MRFPSKQIDISWKATLGLAGVCSWLVVKELWDVSMSTSDIPDEPHELARFVFEHFYLPDEAMIAPFDRAAEGLTGHFSLAALIFRTNLYSATLAASIPCTMASASVAQQRFGAFHIAERIRALKKVEPKQPLTPELEGEAYEIAHSRMVEFKESEEGVIWFRDAILRELNKAGKEPDFRIASEELLFNTLVNSWGTFEVFVSEIVRLLINAKPTLAAGLLSNESTKKHFPGKIFSIEALAVREFNVAASMGDLLLEHRHLDSLGVLKDVFNVIFPDHSALRSALANPELWMLWKRRHLIVHKRGIVDASYLATTSDTTELGARLKITGEYIEDCLVLVRDAAAEVTLALKKEFADLI